MRIRAAGSSCVICFTASMPPISGMMMSIVTRSGFSCWYFSTACLPFSASPTTVKPACDRMSLTIVRMNTASSHTSTVLLLTLPPLSDYLLNHGFYVENQNPLAFNLDHTRYSTRRGRSVANRPELIYWHVLNVPHVVDAEADQSLHVIDEQNQPICPPECGLAQRRPAVDDGHNRPTQIDQPANGV